MRSLCLVSVLGLLAAVAPARQVSITVLATTDLHGNIVPEDPFTGQPVQRGLAKIASLIREVRKENPNTLLVDCGDTIQGTPLEAVYQDYVRTGRVPFGLRFRGGPPTHDPMMLAMNALGYNAMVLGNHDFNFGLKNIERAREDAHFPWLSANTRVETGATVKPFDPYLLRTVGGVKVAVVGVTTPEIPKWELPEHYRGYRFAPLEDGVDSALARLRKEESDLVVLAVHADVTRQYAASLRGVDAVVYGHTHQQLAGEQAGKTLMVQPKNWGASLARLDFLLESEDGGRWKVRDKRARIIPVTESTPADPEVLRIASPYQDLAEHYLNTPIAESPAALDARLGRIEDSPLVDAIQAVQLHYGKADVSFTALFNPRVVVPKGPVTVRQVAALYLYENELCVVEGDGRMVKEALENAARYFRSCPDQSCSHGPLIRRDIPGFNFDMAEGVEYEIDLTRPEGQRVLNLRWKRRPLLPGQKLRIALNNYRAGGSGGYRMFRGAKLLWRSPEDIRSLIIDYYIGHKRLPARADGNWKIVPPQAVRVLEEEAQEEAAHAGTR